MKVLHLVSGSLSAGAARGAYWLHKGLLDLGVDSKLLTSSKETYGDQTVASITINTKEKLAELTRRKADSSLANLYSQRKKLIFSVGLFGYDFTKTSEYQKADILHLHWICRGLVNMQHLRKVDKPIVWTMRDMWPMTGGCHYAMECERYQLGCGKCPQLGSTQSFDLSSFTLRRKKKYLPRTIKLVGISHWMSDCARKSDLFQDFDIRTIHNNVSTQDFFPIEKSIARKILGLPNYQKIVLTGSQKISSFYKGFDVYLKALRYIEPEPLLLFFGGELDLEMVNSLSYRYVNLGFLYDTISLRLAYSAADVFVAPSRMDAFGKTIAEAMACGTPVVCFDATGPRDIVDHQQDGYKAKPFDPKDLAQGIEWVLGNDERQQILSKNACKKVKEKFDVPVIASSYKDFYKELL